jgi:hypothetical protein
MLSNGARLTSTIRRDPVAQRTRVTNLARSAMVARAPAMRTGARRENAMPTVADYAVLRDEPIEISAGSTFETIPFFAPEGFVAGTNLARAILAYKAEPIPLDPFGAIAEFEIQRGIADSIGLIRRRTHARLPVASATKPLHLRQRHPIAERSRLNSRPPAKSNALKSLGFRGSFGFVRERSARPRSATAALARRIGMPKNPT